MSHAEWEWNGGPAPCVSGDPYRQLAEVPEGYVPSGYREVEVPWDRPTQRHVMSAVVAGLSKQERIVSVYQTRMVPVSGQTYRSELMALVYAAPTHVVPVTGHDTDDAILKKVERERTLVRQVFESRTKVP